MKWVSRGTQEEWIVPIPSSLRNDTKGKCLTQAKAKQVSFNLSVAEGLLLGGRLARRRVTPSSPTALPTTGTQ